MKKWILAAVLVVAGIGVVMAMSGRGGGIPVEAALAKHGLIQEFVDERGQTRLPQTYLITMPYDGRISAITLTEGMHVSKGQTVAEVVPLDVDLALAAARAAVDRLDASIRENDDVSVEGTTLTQSRSFVESMDRTVDAARQRVASGKAKLEYADKHLERIRMLRGNRAVSEDEYDQAQLTQVQASVDYQQDLLVQRAMEAMQAATTLMPTVVTQYIDRKKLGRDVLEKQKAEAVARLKQAESNASRGTMLSPVEGTVLARMVSDERQLAGGAELLRIGRLEDLEVEADILSQDVVNVKENDPVRISGPAIGKTPIMGIVKNVYPAGFAKVSSLGVEQQRVKVIVGVDAADLARVRKERELGVGYRVRVRIFTAQNERALVVPRSALFRGPAGNWQLFVVRGGKAELQPVEVGLMNDDAAEITKGVEPEEAVILAPETSLTPGAKVSPLLRELAPQENFSVD